MTTNTDKLAAHAKLLANIAQPSPDSSWGDHAAKVLRQCAEALEAAGCVQQAEPVAWILTNGKITSNHGEVLAHDYQGNESTPLYLAAPTAQEASKPVQPCIACGVENGHTPNCARERWMPAASKPVQAEVASVLMKTEEWDALSLDAKVRLMEIIAANRPKAETAPSLKFGGCPSCGRADCVARSCSMPTPDELLKRFAAHSPASGAVEREAIQPWEERVKPRYPHSDPSTWKPEVHLGLTESAMKAEIDELRAALASPPASGEKP